MYRCPKCSGKLAVIRTIKDLNTGLVHRERRCRQCGSVTYTKETAQHAISFSEARNKAQTEARRRRSSAYNSEPGTYLPVPWTRLDEQIMNPRIAISG